MECITYQNKSDEKVVSKSLEQIGNLQILMKDDSSIINPTFIFSGGAGLFADVNYLYVPLYLRYYYIDDIMTDSNGMTILVCRVDPLMSFADAIRNRPAVVERNESKFNLYVDDGSFKTYANPHVITKNFPQGFTNPSYVLCTVGAGTAPSEE